MKYWDNICKIQQKQTDKGLKKYGQVLEDNTAMDMNERLTYLEEELIDALMYIEHIKSYTESRERVIGKCYSVCKHYGLDHQEDQLMRECGEFYNVCGKIRDNYSIAEGSYFEELCDTIAMTIQIASAMGFAEEEILNQIEKKMDRQLERIARGDPEWNG